MTSFKCLAIETATAEGFVAACNGEQRSVQPLAQGRGSSSGIYAAVRTVLEQTGQQLAELDCIAVGCGPGAFTGVRVAVSAAQALAYASKKSVCSVSTLAVIAAAAHQEHAARYVAVCLDARMGEIYFGSYAFSADGGLSVIAADKLLRPEECSLPAGEHFVAVGNGWAAFPDLLARNIDRVEQCYDSAVLDGNALGNALLNLAEQQFMRGEMLAPELTLPNYLRDKVTG